MTQAPTKPDLSPEMKARLREIEADYLADIAAGYTKEDARLRRAKALKAAHAPKPKKAS